MIMLVTCMFLCTEKWIYLYYLKFVSILFYLFKSDYVCSLLLLNVSSFIFAIYFICISNIDSSNCLINSEMCSCSKHNHHVSICGKIASWPKVELSMQHLIIYFHMLSPSLDLIQIFVDDVMMILVI